MKKLLAIVVLGLLWCNVGFAVSLESILEKANRYTVEIYNSIERPFIEEDSYAGKGTGFLVNKEKGLIITNAHVSGSSPATNEVNFKNEEPIPAKQVYIDPELDLAILKVEPDLIPDNALEGQLECKFNYHQGANTVAFGHPYGQNFTITRGIISGIRFDKLAGFEAIQTDTPINPGNSGGPFIDISSGLIIGISSFGLEDTEGLNFALPSYHVCKVLKLFQEGKDPSPLNFNILFSSNDRLGEYLVVSAVLKKQNRLQVSDRILKANGVSVLNPTGLSTATRGNENVRLEIERKGKTITLNLRLKPRGSLTNRKGLVVSNALIENKFISSYSETSEKVYNPNKQLVVQSVEAGLASGKLKGRDIILFVDGKKITNVDDLYNYLQDKDSVQFILRSRGYFGDELIFYDRHETLKIKDLKFLEFDK